MVGGNSGGNFEDATAKHVLDSIGEKVYKEVKSAADATKYIDELKGDLASATNRSLELIGTIDTCELVKEYYNPVTDNGKRHPCKGLSGKTDERRFSDTLGGQCTNSKMRSGCGVGACAPLRRLHLCDHNLETISNYNSNARHKLLAEVCLAAKYEGDSIRGDHDLYRAKYPDFHTNLCTELARSFADIGDIVRGRDLYLGNTQEKEQKDKLDKNLQKIFGNIYKDLTTNGKSTSVSALKTRYENDKENNYSKLREDWWTANRDQVWKAITCGAGNAQYFRPTCGVNENKSTLAKKKCTCDDGKVPTYFDYVPQFLRWFEEWAEDFCTKRKHKLENAITNCGDKKKNLYCSGNGYDCTKTIRGRHVFVEGEDCPKCFFACSPFVKWLDNQKLEFDKQNQKYTKEIEKYTNRTSGKSKQKRSTRSTNYKGYDEQFYYILKGECADVKNFLQLLSKEGICQSQPQVEGKGTSIDFKNPEKDEIFSHTKYCDPCPWCGVKPNGPPWETEEVKECPREGQKIYNPAKKTKIPKLTAEKDQSGILNKYKNFCANGKNGQKGETGEKGDANSGGQIKTWECYYDESEDSGENNNCVQGEWKDFNEGKKVMSYNKFFWEWVHDMLMDSIEWRNEHGKCINKDNGNTCKSGCNTKCKCFKKWVEQKEKEWKAIKEHFGKQTDIGQEGGLALFTHDYVLEGVLQKKELLKIIKDTYGNAEETEHIKNMLNDDEASHGGDGTEQKGTIVELLKHELEDAETCINCQPRKVPNPCSGEIGGRGKLYDVLAQTVAEILQGEAKRKMLERSFDESGKCKGSKGENKSCLVGNIKNAKIKNGGNVDTLNGDICKINTTHSNANGASTDPCNNKGVRLKIGEKWKSGSKIQFPENDYMPPRRQHMCTSNLEKIDDNFVTKNAKDHVNDTFLLEVLLAAKSEAEDIITKYKQQNQISSLTEENDKKTVCRAIRRSFADIGDIIKGTDLWDKNGDFKNLEDYLIKIFGQIKGELKGIEGKYNDNNKYINLRKDWWTANRKQVWDAMKCAIRQEKIPCPGMPAEDYIPQRLRWMTEWAEWYCKEQDRLYDDLMVKCLTCKNENTECRQNTDECNKCKKACEEYKTEIPKWEIQWKQIEKKYKELYKKALDSANSEQKIRKSAPIVGPKDENDVVEFLNKLQEEASGKNDKDVKTTKDSPATTPITPYATAAGYIHQELPITGCQKQKEFCEYKNGVARTTSGAKVDTNENYAFKDPPKDYVQACDCKPPTRESLARTDTTLQEDTAQLPAGDNIEDDSEEEEIAENENLEEASEEEVPGPPEPSGPVGPTIDNICKIVGDALTTPDNINAACSQKYGPKAPTSWRCVTTNTNNDNKGERGSGGRVRREVVRVSTSAPSDSNQGSICVPPRRRRLYIGGLTKWVKETQLQSQANGSVGGSVNGPQVEGSGKAVSGEGKGQGAQLQEVDGKPGDNGESTSPTTIETPEASLRRAFVESAAIETFFLWDRYKKIKQKEDKEKQQAQTDLVAGATNDDTVQKELEKSGDIPEDFLRQMFYTLGDYADIFFGKNDIFIQNTGSPSDKEMAEKEKTIKEAIDNYFQKISGTSNNGDSHPSKPGPNPLPNSGTTPQTWWTAHAPSIWNGMICALTYDTNSGDKNTLPKQIDKVKEAFFGKDTTLDNKLTPGKQPPNDGGITLVTPPGNPSGTYKDNYDYTTVAIDAKETDAIKPGETNRNAAQGTLLTDFIKRPFFFRWLEEWGEEFCRKQKHKLEIIKMDCRGNGKDCSGDGLVCTEKVPEKKEIYESFHCSTCARHCRFYKMWIRRKKYEFTEQKNAFTKQKEKYITQNTGSERNNNGNEFCTKLKTYSGVGDFLERLKKGPCKNNSEEGNGEDTTGKGHIKFDDDETFKYENYCGTCSHFIVNCNGNGKVCSGTNVKCTGGKINANDIGNGGNSTKELDMLVSDNSGNGNKFDGLDACIYSGIFKGIKKDVWKCGEYCGVDICTLEKKNNNGEGKEHITVKEFLKRWLETFFEDYNRIRTKLKSCIYSGEQSPCIRACANKWIEEKRTKWEKIKKDYLDQYTKSNEEGSNDLNSFLEQFEDRTEVKNAIKPCPKFNKFEKSKECSVYANSQKQGDKQDKKSDVIDCLLDRLQNEIKTCPSSPSDNQTEAQCDTLPPSGEKSPTPDVGDVDDYEEENEEENKVGKQHPSFCKIEEEKKKEVEETGCEPENEKKKEKEKEEQEGGDGGEKEPAKESLQPVPQEPSSDDPQSEGKSPEQAQEEQPAPPIADPPARTPSKPLPQPKPPQLEDPNEYKLRDVLLPSAFPLTVGLSFLALTYWLLKKKTKSSVDMLRVLEIPRNDYGMPTLKSSNKYIPYGTDKYKGKRYIYLEGDSGTDSGYTDHYSDITSSSESEYEEFDINDIYVPHAPKYKTLIEVVLEPSKRDIQNDDIPSGDTIPTSDIPNTPSDIPSPITDDEWNQLKDDFISQYLPNIQPNDYRSADIPKNTHPNTLYFDKPEEKPFIMSIHDRNLLSGEEYNYDMINNSGIYPSSSNRDSYSDNHDTYSDKNSPYSGIDLINDALSGDHDIYDEILKRKENELFGTKHVKHTTTNRFSKPTNSDPITNQLELFHKWIDRHRDMCEKLGNKVDILNQLKEEWDNETHSGNKNSNIPSNIPSSDIQPSDIPSGKLSDIPSDNNIHSVNIHPNDIPSGKLSGTPSDNNIHSDIHPSDIPSGKLSDIHSGKLSDTPSGKLSDTPSNNKPSDIPHVLNTDVSIQIHMDKPKPINIVDINPDNSSMDNILNDLDQKFNEPYYDVQDDIYYDVNDEKPSVDDIPMDHNKVDVPKKVHVEMKILNNTSNGSLEHEFPISDLWNI
ncbi:erythrocyte membrane protein 1, PfEMP1, putative [Plasmodium reichenowi]|uniref:Erythrocyte membrane protein 1, PfEMP1, putative n=1 Tax=Plasmodium reichenowi TaxID=5854 RepID=A0A2P9DM98_PLARE|nr:erythrocyte membrane protein 1, PfEMP1, putative [Plasmodium reichenowi]